MKMFLFYFEIAIKITGSAQNYRVGRVSGNTPIFLDLGHFCHDLSHSLHLYSDKQYCACLFVKLYCEV